MNKLFCLGVIIILLSGCSQQAEEIKEIVILKEALTQYEHFIKYTDGNKIYLENVKTGDRATLAYMWGDILEALELPKEIKSLDTFSEEPTQTNLGIKEEFPTTYKSDLNSSASYLSNLEELGWHTQALYRDYGNIDLILRKEDKFARVLVFEDKIKVFWDISGNMEDAYLYISR